MGKSSSLADTRLFITQHFDDFDAFSEAAKGWDLQFDQLSRGAFEGKLWHCIMPNAQIGRARFNRQLEQQGAAPLGLLTFVIPAQQELNLNWRRKNVGRDDLLINPYNGAFYSISNSCFDVFTISMTEQVLEKAARANEATSVLRLLQLNDVIRLPPAASDHLRTACHLFFKHLKGNPKHFTEGLMDDQLLIEIPRIIVNVIAQSTGNPIPRQVKSKTDQIKKAREAIAAFGHLPISISDLGKMVGMSQRSLLYAFRDEFSISPKGYLQTYRLNRVRKDLRTTAPASAAIANIANEWGFWHMGQFARDYQRQFGELPSQTLNH